MELGALRPVWLEHGLNLLSGVVICLSTPLATSSAHRPRLRPSGVLAHKVTASGHGRGHCSLWVVCVILGEAAGGEVRAWLVTGGEVVATYPFLPTPSPSLTHTPSSACRSGQAWSRIRGWASAPWDVPSCPLTGLSVAGWAWGLFPRTLPAGTAWP